MDRYTIKKNREQIISEYNKGKSIKQLVEEFGVKEPTIRRHLKLSTEIRKIGASEEKKKEIYKLYKKGHKRKEIAEIVGLSPSTVSSILVLDFNVPRVSSKYSSLGEEWIRLHNEGMTISEISKKYNAPVQNVKENIILCGGKINRLRGKYHKIEVKDRYFKNLNKEKAYELGILFSCGRVIRDQLVKDHILLRFSEDRLSLISSVVKKFAEGFLDKVEYRKNGCILKISSDKLVDTLEEYGLGEKIPYFEDKEIRDSFFDGFIKNKISIHKRSIYISLGKSLSDSTGFMKYLTDDIGIDGESVKSPQNKSVYIEWVDDVTLFVDRFPDALNKIREKAKEYEESPDKTNQKWKNYLDNNIKVYDKSTFRKKRVD